MRRNRIGAALFVLSGCSSPPMDPTQAKEDNLPAYELANGYWYTGTGFEPTTMFSSKNSVDEVMNLASLNVFDNATLLEMLCAVTPRAMFPERRVGVLVEAPSPNQKGICNSSLDKVQIQKPIRNQSESLPNQAQA